MNYKIICKQHNSILTLVIRDTDRKRDRILSTTIMNPGDFVEMKCLYDKIFVNLKSGLASFMVDGFENEQKHSYYYPPVK